MSLLAFICKYIVIMIKYAIVWPFLLLLLKYQDSPRFDLDGKKSPKSKKIFFRYFDRYTDLRYDISPTDKPLHVRFRSTVSHDIIRRISATNGTSVVSLGTTNCFSFVTNASWFQPLIGPNRTNHAVFRTNDPWAAICRQRLIGNHDYDKQMWATVHSLSQIRF